jgi:hypothetical protein
MSCELCVRPNATTNLSRASSRYQVTLKKIKLIAIAVAAVFAAGAFFYPSDTARAQKNRTDILSLAAKYKTWQRPVKPIAPQSRPLEPKPLPPTTIAALAPGSIQVNNSSEFG